MEPKVSVILPIYNQEKYLCQCLDSLINQTFKNIEIICFNDASTDNTLQILKDYASKDKRIVIIDSPVNIKSGGGRNAGLRIAKAPYIMFVDPDDWVDYLYVELLYNKAVETNADIVLSNYFEVNNNKISPRNLFENKQNLTTEKIKSLHTESPACLWVNIYKRELFFNNNLFFPENIPLRQDYVIIPSLYLAAKKIIKINDYLYYYRIHSQSACHDGDPKKFKYYFSTTILQRENIKRIDREKKFQKEADDLFINLFYCKTIMSAIGGHKKVLHHEIKYANENILNFIEKEKLKDYISHQSLGSKLIINSARISSHLAYFVYKFIEIKTKTLKFLKRS